MIQSPEMLAKIAEWRHKAREGSLTKEEMREAFAALRVSVGSVVQAAAGSRVSKARSKPANKPDGDELLKAFGDF